ncbi:MAG: hypothetical protein LDL41_19090 [Coleofasciculus sp. S288]|nr:hypothetical protein [Coleofasciculus sp. S288]
MSLYLMAKNHVFIPLQAAAAISIPIGTGLPADDCGIGDVVDALSLGSSADRFGIDCIVVGEQWFGC